MEPEIKGLVGQVMNRFQPHSVFLYGSRARGDNKEDSDYEIGVLYSHKRRVTRMELKEVNPLESVILYPFEYESFLEGSVDVPFPETLFLRELAMGGARTLTGEQVVENFHPPSVQLIHVLERSNFDVGVAFTSMLVYRAGDLESAKRHFYKSCLFGARSLLLLKNREFPLRYKEIHDAALNIDLGGHEDVLKKSLRTRFGENVSEEDFYRNISFLTRIVRREILKVFEEQQDLVLLN